ncbi:hypothetical protein [Microbacterium sp. zg-YB36]|uniref:hypothetical protein n=1 Tax=Microbacterium sp. zg-YB36 TaxID=2969407 RepID=UPI00214C70C9|nr:hypothetical protein [Microbacterium sp. zg-YB36]MDL5352359.1 hypothetical protein [Microbacterium sp. zg-YB36]
MSLDLSGAHVLTEAATGAYAVTPVLAALAGAEVRSVAKSSRHGTSDEAAHGTLRLAEALGVAGRISIRTERQPADFAWADVTTNSGHLRPITGDCADAMRPASALSLMFETWEIQAGRIDVDLDGLVRRGVRVAGTNERHPHIDVFSYLGLMAVVQLADAGIPAYGSRIGVLCDNPFLPYLVSGLQAAGATVDSSGDVEKLLATSPAAILVARTPNAGSVLTAQEQALISAGAADIVLVRYWGDFEPEGVAAWPKARPAIGHMAVLPSRVGPDAVVRLQAGGLKVGELLLREPSSLTLAEREYIDELA